VALKPIILFVPQQSFHEPMMRIHIGWMLTKIAANSVHNVGAWTCKQVPLRLALHLHHTNCVRLSITVIINATWNPWKKSTIPLPAPLFMKVAPTFRRAATTIGQHQAPMMAGKDRHRTPIAPRNWQNVIGSVFLSTESGSPVGSSSGGGASVRALLWVCNRSDERLFT